MFGRARAQSASAEHRSGASETTLLRVGQLTRGKWTGQRSERGMVSKMLSHYRLVEKIGEGGMGVVWKAEDTVLNRTVAIKVLPADLALDEERRQLFLNEARLAASVSHGNIVQVHELGREGDLDFIVMEYVDGQPLSRMLQGRSLPPDKTTEIGLQVAEGLARAHRKGLIHRDLKPANILVTPEGDVKIVDFGLATLFSPLETTLRSTTRTLASAGHDETHREIVGTLPYMSPEQVRGEKLDARSDIFSFGTVLYEMTTGRRPFRGSTPAEIAQEITRCQPTPVREVVPKTPIALDLSIEKALARNLRDRYQVMDDMAVDLRRLIRDLESSSSPSYSDLRQGPLRGRRRRAAVIAIVTTAAAAAVAVYGVSHLRKPSPDQARGFQAMQMRRLTNSGDIERAALSPDGRFLAQVRVDQGLYSLWVRQIATESEVAIVTEQENRIRDVSFSPDGEYLYYQAIGGGIPSFNTLFQVASFGGTPRKILFDVDTGVTFSPDGKLLAFVRDAQHLGESALMVANADGSAERKLSIEKRPRRFSLSSKPSWSPDGRRIAVLLFLDTIGHELVAVSAADGKPTKIGTARWGGIDGFQWLPDGSGLVLSGLGVALGESSKRQIWQVEFPSGRAHRITNDLNDYSGISVTSNGKGIATVQLIQNADLYAAPVSDLSAVRQITSGSTTDDAITGFAIAMDGTILFAQVQEPFRHLYSIDGEGKGRRQLTSGPSFDFGPLTVHKGRVVVFTSYREDRVPHVYKMDLDGSNLAQLTDGAGEMANSVDPQGRWALHTRTDSSKAIWRVPLSGGPSTWVVEPFIWWTIPGFSPDGERIAYFHYDQTSEQLRGMLTVITAEGGAPIATLPAPGYMCSWSPDSRAFDYAKEVDGTWNVWRQPLDGGEPRRLTDFASLRIFSFHWSPGGEQLVLSRGEIRSDVVAISGFR